MTAIVARRLHNQKLAGSELGRPADVIAWLGAAQAQDYAAATWAIGLRARAVTSADVEQAFTDGRILRTHVLRPTWHFVTPEDIRWMLALTGPRVHAGNAFYYRKLGLDRALFARSRRALERALQGGRQLTRAELAAALQRTGIVAKGLRLAYLMMYAELDALICSGARRDKQFTYALLDERVPPAASGRDDEALAELTRRYFTSRGPATVRDFAWWSGLTTRDITAGIEMAGTALVQDVIEGRTYWRADSTHARRRATPTVYLLPIYDEFGIAYKDRDVVPAMPAPGSIGDESEYMHLLVIDGHLVGRWRRTLKTSTVIVEAHPFRALTRSETRALEAAVAQYGKFMNLAAELDLHLAGMWLPCSPRGTGRGTKVPRYYGVC